MTARAQTCSRYVKKLCVDGQDIKELINMLLPAGNAQVTIEGNMLIDGSLISSSAISEFNTLTITGTSTNTTNIELRFFRMGLLINTVNVPIGLVVNTMISTPLITDSCIVAVNNGEVTAESANLVNYSSPNGNLVINGGKVEFTAASGGGSYVDFVCPSDGKWKGTVSVTGDTSDGISVVNLTSLATFNREVGTAPPYSIFVEIAGLSGEVLRFQGSNGFGGTWDDEVVTFEPDCWLNGTTDIDLTITGST